MEPRMWKRSQANWIAAGLLLAMLLASLDQAIIVTAVPTIAAEFGDYNHFSWIFSAYIIAELIAMPIFGKLCDMYGRRRFFLLALLLFMLGSILCGIAGSIGELIAYRVLQGLGAGAIMPIAFTIVFDIYPPSQGNRMQSLFAVMFGISSVLGPVIGAGFTEYVNWRWIFYANLPLGFISLAILLRLYKEAKMVRKHKVDWAGLFLLFGSLLSLMLAFEMGGSSHSWLGWPVVSLFAGFVCLFALFLWVETRVKEPFIPLGLFKLRMFAVSQVVGFFQGVVMTGAFTFLPLFIQTVAGGNAEDTGKMLMPLSFSMVISSYVGGMIVRRIRYRDVMLLSNSLVLVASVWLCLLDAQSSQWLLAGNMVLLGLGIGMSFPAIYTSSLYGADPAQMGIRNSLIPFFRSIGGAIGVCLFGSLQVYQFVKGIARVPADPSMAFPRDNVNGWLTYVQSNPQAEAIGRIVADELTHSLLFVFQGAAIASLVALAAGLFLGNTRSHVPYEKPAPPDAHRLQAESY